MKINPFGLGICLLSLGLPLLWVLPLAQQVGSGPMLSQYFGMLALLTMAWAQIMSTRITWVERLFGPMDQVYRVHKWLGIAAVLAMVLHENLDAEVDALGRATGLNDFGEDLGEWAYNGLLVLVAATLMTFIPYRLWHWTHRVIGVFFVLSSIHFFLVQKPFSMGEGVGIYVGVFCVAGIAAFVWKSLPRSFRMSHRYEVREIERTGAATAMTLEPAGTPLRHMAGQFAFVSFDRAGQRETHPFTISSAPNDAGDIRFTIAPLGGFTKALPSAVSIGDTLRIEGPFGRFFPKIKAKNQIWIAAGVGVTPFVSWLDRLNEIEGDVTLFYCVRTMDSAAHLDELQEAFDRHPNARLIVWESARQGRLNLENMQVVTGRIERRTPVFFCGPKAMQQGFGAGLRASGHSRRAFHYEEFEIRTGIGITRALRGLIGLLRPSRTSDKKSVVFRR